MTYLICVVFYQIRFKHCRDRMDGVMGWWREGWMEGWVGGGVHGYETDAWIGFYSLGLCGRLSLQLHIKYPQSTSPPSHIP